MSTESRSAIKAQPFKALVKFLGRELTPEQHAALIKSLTPEDAAYLHRIVLAGDWIPIDVMNRITEAAAASAGKPLDSFARSAGRFAADEAVNGIYRWIVFLRTPAFVLGKASRAWSTLYNRGRLELTTEGRSAAVVLHDFPSHPAGCGRVTGWMEKLGEMTGVENLRVIHRRCRANGAPECEWSVTWD